MTQLTIDLLAKGRETMAANNGPIPGPAEREAMIEYYTQLLAKGTISPSRRRLVETELRKLENPQQ
jgi:hypothetical protein